MKKFIPFFLLVLFFSYTVSFADTSSNPVTQQNISKQLPDVGDSETTGIRKEYLAEQKVKMLPSSHGKTIDS